MKERALRTDAREAKGLHDGSITRVVRPVKFNVEWPVHVMRKYDRPYTNSKPRDVWWNADHRQEGTVFVEHDIRCPLGIVGDRLWVQESFGWIGHVDCGNPKIYEVTDLMDRRRDILYYTDCPDFVWTGEDGSSEDSRGR